MSEKITFQELIESIAEETDHSKQFTHDFFKDFVDVIHGGLEDDGRVNIAGWGKFKLRPVDEREGYNPQTEEKITIPAHNKIVFKPYKSLREKVNAPYAHLEAELIEEKEEDTKENESDAKAAGTAPDPEPTRKQEEAPDSLDGKKSSSNFELDGDSEETDKDIVEFDGSVDTGQEEDTDKEIEEFLGGGTEETDAGEEQPEEYDKNEETESGLEDTAEDTGPDSVSPYAPGFDNSDKGEDNDFEETAPPSPTIDRNLESRKKGTSLPFIVAAAGVLLLVTVGVWYFSIFNNGTGSTSGPSGQSVATADISATRQNNQQQSAEGSANTQRQSGKNTQNTAQVSQSDQDRGSTSSQDNQKAEKVNMSIKKGQTLWSIAEERYGNPRLWPWIYGTNERLRDPDLILAGNQLSVPLPSGPQNTLTSSDSVGVSKGYLATYSWYKDQKPSKARNHLWAAKLFHDDIRSIADVKIDESDLSYANNAR